MHRKQYQSIHYSASENKKIKMSGKNMNPFFSIIIPAYNRAGVLDKALLSVRDQTCPDWECIVVDDGSTDNTRDLLVKWSEADTRFRYVYQENAERSAARNNGIRNAGGKYICFLDSDDEYLPCHLSVLFQKIKAESEPEALFFTHTLFRKNGEIIREEMPEMKEDIFGYLMIYPVIPARVCIHNHILRRYNFREDTVIAEDQVLWGTIALHYPVIQVSEYTVVYNMSDDNSVNISKNCHRIRLIALRRFFAQKDVKKKLRRKLKCKLISDCYFGMARYHSHKRAYFKSAFNLLISVFYCPVHPQTKAKIHMILFPHRHRY